MPSVLIIIPTAGFVHPEVKQAIQNLTFPQRDVHVEICKPIYEHSVEFCRRALNATHTRNQARLKALQTDHTHYLWLDSDVAPPPDVIEQLLAMNNDAAGGWYAVRDGRNILNGRWVAGEWVDVGVFANYHFPWVLKPDEPDDAPYGSYCRKRRSDQKVFDPVRSDLAPLGCLLITREVLELLEFQHGTDIPCKINGIKGDTVRADCLQYGVQLWEIGVDVYMSSRVLCRHIP